VAATGLTDYDSFEPILEDASILMQSHHVRSSLIALFVAVPCALSAQLTQVPTTSASTGSVTIRPGPLWISTPAAGSPTPITA